MHSAAFVGQREGGVCEREVSTSPTIPVALRSLTVKGVTTDPFLQTVNFQAANNMGTEHGVIPTPYILGCCENLSSLT